MDITNVANLSDPAAAVLETKNIPIGEMTRDERARTLEALRHSDGVMAVKVDHARGLAAITFDTRETNFPEIHDVLLESYRPSRNSAR